MLPIKLICQAFLVLIVILCSSSSSVAKTTESQATAAKACRINLKKEVHLNNSITVIQESPIVDYIYPDIADPENLVVKSGKSISIFCPGKTDGHSSAIKKPGYVQHDGTKYESSVRIVCQSGTSFELKQKKQKKKKMTVRFGEFSCEKEHGPILREAKSASCERGQLYEIGYVVTTGMKEEEEEEEELFIKTIELCHDDAAANTLWAHAVIQPVNTEKSRYTGGDRKAFKSGVLFKGMNMMNIYNKESVYDTAYRILQDREAVDKYFSKGKGGSKYLAKGHLIASADKLYKSEQDSTMFFANTVPMWQKVNAPGGNWFAVEEYVRFLANATARPLHVWVGGIKKLKLQGKEIYLHIGQSSKGPAGSSEAAGLLQLKVPVPRIIFKCVVDKEKRRALVFLVVNNPYANPKRLEGGSGGKYSACQRLEACEKIFTHWDDAGRGYFYCCELADFYAKNREELGLEQLEEFLDYDKLDLITHDKLRDSLSWDVRGFFSKILNS